MDSKFVTDDHELDSHFIPDTVPDPEEIPLSQEYAQDIRVYSLEHTQNQKAKGKVTKLLPLFPIMVWCEHGRGVVLRHQRPVHLGKFV